jgi:hypothetical protein
MGQLFDLSVLTMEVVESSVGLAILNINFWIWRTIVVESINRMKDWVSHTHYNKNKIFSLPQGIESPNSYGGLAYARSSLIHIHVIVGYDHRPSQEVHFAFRDSTMQESQVFWLFKPRSPKYYLRWDWQLWISPWSKGPRHVGISITGSSKCSNPNHWSLHSPNSDMGFNVWYQRPSLIWI